jgi:release factor glutamine methyltransferase
MGAVTIAHALGKAKVLGLASLDAQVLLSHCMARSRSYLIAHPDSCLADSQRQLFERLAGRRARGVPMAYLIEEKEFHGLLLQVTSKVLIPRPETEHLVDWGLEILREHRAVCGQPRVIDLGTGSGAIALAIKHSFPAARVEGIDDSSDALQVAKANGARCGLDVSFYPSDWWTETTNLAYHLALCNPPYIAADDPHLGALKNEPRNALTTGGHGLEDLAAVIRSAPLHLQPGGWLLMEHGFDQARAVRQLFHDQGFEQTQTRRDLAGLERCTGACLSRD